MKYSKAKTWVHQDDKLCCMTMHELAAVAELRMEYRKKTIGFAACYDWQTDISMAIAAFFMIEDSSACQSNFKFTSPPCPMGLVESSMNYIISTAGGDPKEWTVQDIFPWLDDPVEIELTTWIYAHEDSSILAS